MNDLHSISTRPPVHIPSVYAQRAKKADRAQLGILVAIGLVLFVAMASPVLLGIPALFLVLGLAAVYRHYDGLRVRFEALSKPPSKRPLARNWHGERARR